MTRRGTLVGCLVLLASLGCSEQAPAAGPAAAAGGGASGVGGASGAGAAAHGGGGSGGVAGLDAGALPRADASVSAGGSPAAVADAASCLPPRAPESWMSMGFRTLEDPPAERPADGIVRIPLFTAETVEDTHYAGGWHQWIYRGATGTGVSAMLAFEGDDAITTDSLLGVPVGYASWQRFYDCVTDGVGEASVSAGHALRDSAGKLLFAYGAATPVTDDGTVLWVPELLPEITSLRTVAVTTDPCQRGRRGLEVTLASTQTVVLRRGESREVSIDGEPYTVAARGVGDPAPGTCDASIWVLFRTSFVHIAK